MLLITPDGFRPSSADLVALRQKLRDTVQGLKNDKHIQGPPNGQLLALTNEALNFAQAYEKTGDELHYQKLVQTVSEFKEELTRQIEGGNLDNVAIRELAEMRNRLEDAQL